MKNIRFYIYWFLDFLKGSPVKKHFIEIKDAYNDLNKKDEIQNKRLVEILNYTINNIPFYKNISQTDLKSFPIITKQDFIENEDLMFSKLYLEDKHNLHKMSTSGSSGTPFTIYQNKNKVLRNKADLIFFYEIGGYNIGDRLYSMRIWNSLNSKNKFEEFKENIRMFDTANLTKEGAKHFKERMLQDKSNKVILAYASSFTALLKNLNSEDKNLKWKISSIFTGAEELPLKDKREMENIFNCPIISRYSNQENGILAQQLKSGEDYFLLNEGSYIFEFLKLNSNEEAKENEPCRIVVTDLFNKAIPMIRYDTGDLCTYSTLNGRKYIKTIEGRKTDFIRNSKNELLSPHVITNLIWEFPNIIQFQFIQNSLTEIEMLIVLKEPKLIDNLKQNLDKKLRNILGQDISIRIDLIDDIPMEASGKRKYIVSKISQDV